MTNKEKMGLLNNMEVTEISSNISGIEYILVGDNKVNRGVLYQIGLSDQEIEDRCHVEEGNIDITELIFKYFQCTECHAGINYGLSEGVGEYEEE